MNTLGMASSALRSLWRRKLRSFLMMAGVLIGVASLTVLSSIGAGTSQVTMGRFKNMLGTFDTLMVQPGGAKNRGMVTVANTEASLSFDDADAIARQVPAIRQVVDVMDVLDGDISYRDRHETAGVFGVSVNWPQVRGDQDVQGCVDVRAVRRDRVGDGTRHGWNGRLMKDVVDALDDAFRNLEIGEIAFDEFDFRQVRDILALASNQAVDHPYALAATDEFFSQVRTNEAGPAGDQVVRHTTAHLSKISAALPGRKAACSISRRGRPSGRP